MEYSSGPYNTVNGNGPYMQETNGCYGAEYVTISGEDVSYGTIALHQHDPSHTITASNWDVAMSPNLIIHGSNGEPMVTIDTATGDVTFGSTYQPEEAARTFWQCVGNFAPGNVDDRVVKLKGEIEDLEQSVRYERAMRLVNG